MERPGLKHKTNSSQIREDYRHLTKEETPMEWEHMENVSHILREMQIKTRELSVLQ